MSGLRSQFDRSEPPQPTRARTASRSARRLSCFTRPEISRRRARGGPGGRSHGQPTVEMPWDFGPGSTYIPAQQIIESVEFAIDPQACGLEGERRDPDTKVLAAPQG